MDTNIPAAGEVQPDNKKKVKLFFVYIFFFLTAIIALAVFIVFYNKNKPSLPPIQNNSSTTTGIIQKSGPVHGQLLVKFKKGVTDSEINEHLKPLNSRILNYIQGINVTVIEIPQGQEEIIRNKLTQDTIVQYAERNYYVHADLIPNDTDFGKEWGLMNTGGSVIDPKTLRNQQGTANADIHMANAWDVTKGGGVKVGIIDTGIDMTHPDLANKIMETTVLSTSGIDDKFGHGTHVAGILAANTNNSQGIAGVCPDCQLYIAKALDDQGDGDMAMIAQGITWAVDKSVKVINISSGSPNNTQTIVDAVKYAQDKGVVVVAAAGNNGDNKKFYPAAIAGVVSVAATDNNDKLANFSSYGSWVQIAAPGFAIYSTLPHSLIPGLKAKYPNVTQSYGALHGSSMSAPFVSGVAALIFSTSFGSSADTVIKRLCDTADKIEGTGSYWICGRLNAEAAIKGASIIPPGNIQAGVPSPACIGNCPTLVPEKATQPLAQVIAPSPTAGGIFTQPESKTVAQPTSQTLPANEQTGNIGQAYKKQIKNIQSDNGKSNNGKNEGLIGIIIMFIQMLLKILLSLFKFGN